MSGKLDRRSYAGTPKNFQSTHIIYKAHRAVIFAIAWHLVELAVVNKKLSYRRETGRQLRMSLIQFLTSGAL